MNRDHCDNIAGYLCFIENKHLRKLVSKGTNFQEKRTIDSNRCKDFITKEVTDCTQRLKEIGIIGEKKIHTSSNVRKCEFIKENIKFFKKLGFKISIKAKDFLLMY